MLRGQVLRVGDELPSQATYVMLVRWDRDFSSNTKRELGHQARSCRSTHCEAQSGTGKGTGGEWVYWAGGDGDWRKIPEKVDSLLTRQQMTIR